MGRFSKSLIDEIILEWEGGYLYYKSIKKAIRKLRDQKQSLQQEIIPLISSQLDRTHSIILTFSSSLQERSSKMSSVSLEDRINDLQLYSKVLKNQISFSSLNLKIITRCLQRLESLSPGSKSKFLSLNNETLKSMQNLSTYKENLSIILTHFYILKPRDSAFKSIEVPLLSKSQNSDLEDLSLLINKVKDELNKLENIDLFPKDPDYPDFMTLLLSVISAFIHLTNLYMLTLAAKDYSVYVGMDKSFAGILNAVNWTASFCFALVLSFWTSYQYKWPTVLCSLFEVIGNFMYFFAYYYKSTTMLLLGRFLIGIGAARVINRRYITTYVSLKARTTWNSFYVAGSIIGRGFGPIVAAGLYSMEFDLLGYEINGINSPALFMACIWVLYMVLTLLYFKEPEIEIMSEEKIKYSKSLSLFPAVLTVIALIVPRIIHESYVTAIPIVAPEEFRWTMDFIGVYLAAVSLAVAPVHIFIAFTSDLFEDRQFIRWALFITTVGSCFLIDFDELNEIQYILGTFLMYMGMNIDDAVTASLLSKVIPPHLSLGIFNAGFIVVFVGSLARGIGGLTIALAGWYEDDAEDMENVLFIPLTLLSVITLAIFWVFYYTLGTQDTKKKSS
ncbi:hypothetical protein SteCoe_21339 [Stentor coeruleus]|uniref:SPX domain-containing protein n=1 Tax=Stentor coeruleus TaxID=5963 RepID=A0A1R2BPX2_9CILI|nr:hypothetical protein SteCoe_21339 [Stentor coeruleus]